METLFDADLSGVRVQIGLEPLAWGAVACAQGNTIFFSPGSYRPTSHAGLELIAHELTHVLQQRSGRVRRSDSGPVVEDSQLEGEAQVMGTRAASLPVLNYETSEMCSTSRLSCDAPIQRQVIWAANKKSEYGFLAEIDQLEVHETADTLVARGHGPKVDITESFQLLMGNSKYIYLVGHSSGKYISGYSPDEVFQSFSSRGLQDGMKFKAMACNVGMINGFVIQFQRKLKTPYPTAEIRGVDRIVYYTKETKFLYTTFPNPDLAEYNQEELRRPADNDLLTKTWNAVKLEIQKEPAFLEVLSAFYQRFKIKKNPDVVQSLQKAASGDKSKLDELLKKAQKYIDEEAGPKQAYELNEAIKPTLGHADCKLAVQQAFTEFQQRAAEGWQKKKDWLRKHHHLDVEQMSGPSRLKKAIDKGDPILKPLRPYLTQTI
jgi:hypothetical protein